MGKLPKGYHDNTVCSNCGSKTTKSGWYRTYNKDGNWDRKSYHCMRCHTHFNHNTGKFSRFSKNPDLSNISKLNFMSSDSVQLKNKKIGRHKDTICSNCGSKSTSGHWYRMYSKDKSWDEKSWMCSACYKNSAFRSGELNPNSNVYKGMIGVRTIAKVLGNEDCIIMSEGSLFDIQSSKYERVEVKTVSYNSKHRWWHVSGIKSEFDTLFILCIDSKFKNVIRIYIISKEKVGDISNINIYKDPSKCGRYKKFRVNIVQYQKAFQIIKNESQISKNFVDNNQNFMSSKEKGNMGEEIVKYVTGAKINSRNEEYDLEHEEYGRIEVKTAVYNTMHKHWFISSIKSYKFDTLFIICMDNDFEKVERVYIIHEEEVGVKTIAILKNSLITGWYEEFEVDNEPYQDVYSYLCRS